MISVKLPNLNSELDFELSGVPQSTDGVLIRKPKLQMGRGGSRTSSWGVIYQIIVCKAHTNLAMPTFVKITPTLLPRTRQIARDVNGTRCTNRFLAIFCVRSRFIS